MIHLLTRCQGFLAIQMSSNQVGQMVSTNSEQVHIVAITTWILNVRSPRKCLI